MKSKGLLLRRSIEPTINSSSPLLPCLTKAQRTPLNHLPKQYKSTSRLKLKHRIAGINADDDQPLKNYLMDYQYTVTLPQPYIYNVQLGSAQLPRICEVVTPRAAARLKIPQKDCKETPSRKYVTLDYEDELPPPIPVERNERAYAQRELDKQRQKLVRSEITVYPKLSQQGLSAFYRRQERPTNRFVHGSEIQFAQ